MKKFSNYLIEQKNTHMEHIEDLVFNEGVDGTRKAIKFLVDLRNMLAGNSSEAIQTTVKWDGAPAIFCGIDPSDGKFFVAKKGIFNKEAKVYKTPEDVKADTGGDLQTKLLVALSEKPNSNQNQANSSGCKSCTQCKSNSSNLHCGSSSSFSS